MDEAIDASSELAMLMSKKNLRLTTLAASSTSRFATRNNALIEATDVGMSSDVTTAGAVGRCKQEFAIDS